MVPIRENLLKQYKLGSTVEGTRKCHYFLPESTSEIRATILSMEEKFTILHSFDVSPEEAHTKLKDSLKPDDYITCIYGEHWWLALLQGRKICSL